MFKDLLAGCATLVFPPHCLLCHNTLEAPLEENLCIGCRARLIRNTPPFCVKCSRHVSHGVPLCRDCRRHRPDFDFAYAALVFNPALKQLLHQFKYHRTSGLRISFAGFMIEFIETYRFDIAQFDMIVPIPLFASNRRLRGYNQSLLLAKAIARHFSIPLNTNILLKSRPTASQSELKRKERWTNLTGAFTIKHSVNLKGQKILLVDDLLTTGATASTAARTLKDAGSDLVGVLALAAVL